MDRVVVDLKEGTVETIALTPAEIAARPKPTEAQLRGRVTALRAEKLTVGFDYDFGDARGVHRFGTTPADLAGWEKVARAVNAALALNAPATEIEIRTDTGDTVIQAQEWPAIDLAGFVAFQPVWAASWAIKDAITAGEVTALAEVDQHPAWPA